MRKLLILSLVINLYACALIQAYFTDVPPPGAINPELKARVIPSSSLQPADSLQASAPGGVRSCFQDASLSQQSRNSYFSGFYKIETPEAIKLSIGSLLANGFSLERASAVSLSPADVEARETFYFLVAFVYILDLARALEQISQLQGKPLRRQESLDLASEFKKTAVDLHRRVTALITSEPQLSRLRGRAYFHTAYLLAEEENAEAATSFLEEAIRISDGVPNASLFARLSIYYSRSGNVRLARAARYEALRRYNEVDAGLIEKQLLSKADTYLDAAKHLDFYDIDDDSYVELEIQAEYLRALRLYKREKAVLERLHAKYPERVEPILMLAKNSLWQTRSPKESIRYLDEVTPRSLVTTNPALATNGLFYALLEAIEQAETGFGFEGCCETAERYVKMTSQHYPVIADSISLTLKANLQHQPFGSAELSELAKDVTEAIQLVQKWPNETFAWHAFYLAIAQPLALHQLGTYSWVSLSNQAHTNDSELLRKRVEVLIHRLSQDNGAQALAAVSATLEQGKGEPWFIEKNADYSAVRSLFSSTPERDWRNTAIEYSSIKQPSDRVLKNRAVSEFLAGNHVNAIRVSGAITSDSTTSSFNHCIFKGQASQQIECLESLGQLSDSTTEAYRKWWMALLFSTLGDKENAERSFHEISASFRTAPELPLFSTFNTGFRTSWPDQDIEFTYETSIEEWLIVPPPVSLKRLEEGFAD